jgi:hypothetical protein
MDVSTVAAILAAAIIQRPDFDLTEDPVKNAAEIFCKVRREVEDLDVAKHPSRHKEQ